MSSVDPRSAIAARVLASRRLILVARRTAAHGVDDGFHGCCRLSMRVPVAAGCRARRAAKVAIAVSCTPVPVRSADGDRFVRHAAPCAVPATISPSSAKSLLGGNHPGRDGAGAARPARASGSGGRARRGRRARGRPAPARSCRARIRTHRGDVLAGAQPFGRGSVSRAGVVVTMMSASRPPPRHRRSAAACGDAERVRPARRRRLGLGRDRAPRSLPADRPHQAQRLELQPRLHAGADDRRPTRGIRPRQMRGPPPPRPRRCAHRSDSRCRAAAPRPGRCGRRTGSSARRLGSPSLGLSKKPGRDLDREAVDAGHIGGLHVDLAIVLAIAMRQDRRHHHLAAGQRPNASSTQATAARSSGTASRRSASVRMRDAHAACRSLRSSAAGHVLARG